jgi:hypothetical protein
MLAVLAVIDTVGPERALLPPAGRAADQVCAFVAPLSVNELTG